MKKLVLILLSISFSVLAIAQNTDKNITVSGKLTDSVNNTPLGYVTVTLTNIATNYSISTLAKDDGSFQFDNLTPHPYKLSFESVGYRKKTITITGKGRILNIGKIAMSPSTNGLNVVNITANKPVIKQEVDRITYDVQADPESKVLNVLDLLRKVPLISLDANDNILLKGSGDYKILINGKPSSLVVHSPKDIFRSMPASSIQKIEVITTPPAKYDSEGLAGIINIITNKKIDNGYNGTININHTFPVGGPSLGGSFTYKTGKFGVATYYGTSQYKQPQTNSLYTRTTTGAGASDLNQSGTRYSNSYNRYIGTEFSYEADSLNLLTADINFNGGNSTAYSNQYSLGTYAPDSVVAYDIANNNKGHYNGFDVGLNYQLGFAHKKDKLLTFAYKYTIGNSNQFNDLDITSRRNFPVLGNPDYQQNNKQKSGEQLAQLDYVQTVNKLNIEAGLKGILRTGDSNFEFDTLRYNPANPDPLQYDLSPQRTNAYNNTQYILGAYNSYQYNFGNWGLKAGGRLEETITNADFISTASKVDQNYFNFIPSIFLHHKFANLSSINFGFTQRLSRPGISSLNPFVDRSNPNFVSSGNPNLKPVISNIYQVNYGIYKKGSINIGLSYSVASNTIQQISTYDTATRVTSSRFDNIGKNRVLASTFNINYPLTELWSFTLNGNMNYIWIAGNVNGLPTKNKGVQGYFYSSTGYKLGKGYRVYASLNFNSPYISLQGKSNSYLYSAFSASKELVKNKLTISAAVNNPSKKYLNYISKTTGANFTQVYNGQSYLRVFSLNLYYHFGKLKDAIRKNQRTINTDETIKSTTPN